MTTIICPVPEEFTIEHQLCKKMIALNPDFAVRCIMAGNNCHKGVMFNAETKIYYMTFVIKHIDNQDEVYVVEEPESTFNRINIE